MNLNNDILKIIINYNPTDVWKLVSKLTRNVQQTNHNNACNLLNHLCLSASFIDGKNRFEFIVQADPTLFLANLVLKEQPILPSDQTTTFIPANTKVVFKKDPNIYVRVLYTADMRNLKIATPKISEVIFRDGEKRDANLFKYIRAREFLLTVGDVLCFAKYDEVEFITYESCYMTVKNLSYDC